MQLACSSSALMHVAARRPTNQSITVLKISNTATSEEVDPVYILVRERCIAAAVRCSIVSSGCNEAFMLLEVDTYSILHDYNINSQVIPVEKLGESPAALCQRHRDRP